MAKPGPAPKRTEARRRRNTPSVPVTEAPPAPVPTTDAHKHIDPDWHPIAAAFYTAHADSPVSYFYEPSDWAMLRLTVDAMSASLLRHPGKVSPEMLRSVTQVLDDLLTCEGSRRSHRIETPPAPLAPPEPLPHWLPRAVDWYSSLSESGQSAFYQASDWAWAVYVAEVISRYAAQGLRIGGLMLACVNRATSMLLCTEGSRRAARLEVARAEADDVDADITALMDRYASYVTD